MPTVRQLAQIAIGGGLFTLSGITGMIYYTQRIFRQQGFYIKSMELLENYEPAQYRLGKPIRAKDINLGQLSLNYTDGLKAKLMIPVKGRKTGGVMFVNASREKPGDEWNIDKLDLLIPSYQQRWTFYYNPRIPEEADPIFSSTLNANISSETESETKETPAPESNTSINNDKKETVDKISKSATNNDKENKGRNENISSAKS